MENTYCLYRIPCGLPRGTMRTVMCCCITLLLLTLIPNRGMANVEDYVDVSVTILGHGPSPRLTIQDGNVISSGGGVAYRNDGYVVMNGVKMEGRITFLVAQHDTSIDGFSDILIRSASSWANGGFDRGKRFAEPDYYNSHIIFEVDDVALFTLGELVQECNSFPNGGTLDVPAGVKLIHQLWYLSGRSVADENGNYEVWHRVMGWEEKYDELSVQLTCKPAGPPPPTEQPAQVQDLRMTWECPETPQNDATHYQENRLVIDGTTFRKVTTAAPDWQPNCVRVSESGTANMSKVIEGFQ